MALESPGKKFACIHVRMGVVIECLFNFLMETILLGKIKNESDRIDGLIIKNMWSIIPYTVYFCIFDVALTHFNLKGVYYILHAMHNIVVIADVLRPPYNEMPVHTLDLVIGFHLYHIILYFKKLRCIDWAHHILMCGILVLIYYENIGGLPLRYSLFFTTGLPGLCDYTILALERNGYMSNNCYRIFSKHINVWIRGPGCVIASFEIAKFGYYSLNHRHDLEKIACYFFALLVFWNGCYFAMKAVEAEAIRIERQRIAGVCL